MSENPNIQKALKILCDLSIGAGRRDALDALDDAGLITTPLHERALKACEGMATYWSEFDGKYLPSTMVYREVIQAGRKSLAAKQPKERWSVRQSCVRDSWLVEDLKEGAGNIGALTESQARAVAKALNETEGK